jgi:hypothetical protein
MTGEYDNNEGRRVYKGLQLICGSQYNVVD